MPPAAARSRMARDVASSHCSPNVMVPRQRRETERPVRPRRAWRMRGREYPRARAGASERSVIKETAMEYRVLGRTGLGVSALAFGCGEGGGLMVRGAPAD